MSKCGRHDGDGARVYELPVLARSQLDSHGFLMHEIEGLFLFAALYSLSRFHTFPGPVKIAPELILILGIRPLILVELANIVVYKTFLRFLGLLDFL